MPAASTNESPCHLENVLVRSEVEAAALRPSHAVEVASHEADCTAARNSIAWQPCVNGRATGREVVVARGVARVLYELRVSTDRIACRSGLQRDFVRRILVQEVVAVDVVRTRRVHAWPVRASLSDTAVGFVADVVVNHRVVVRSPSAGADDDAADAVIEDRVVVDDPARGGVPHLDSPPRVVERYIVGGETVGLQE